MKASPATDLQAVSARRFLKVAGDGQLPQRKSMPEGIDRGAHDLRDDVMSSLFGAALALDRLLERVIEPDGKRAVEAAMAHLDDVVRDLRLLLRAIDDLRV